MEKKIVLGPEEERTSKNRRGFVPEHINEEQVWRDGRERPNNPTTLSKLKVRRSNFDNQGPGCLRRSLPGEKWGETRQSDRYQTTKKNLLTHLRGGTTIAIIGDSARKTHIGEERGRAKLGGKQ